MKAGLVMSTSNSPRVHGGPDGLGVPRHDFSTNSNACGPCPAAQMAVSGADATRYPDASYTRLRRQLADFHHVDEARVLLAASASEFEAWVSSKTQDWLAGSLETLRTWKARQLGLCESLGWRCLPSDANFFCAQPALPEGLSQQQALAALRTQGIKLRDTASSGLPGHVRLGVQPPAVQDALYHAWQ